MTDMQELNKLSPEPLYNARDYFDNEEQELERKRNEKLRQVQELEVHPAK